jgi:hypothetical protein
MKRTAVQVQSTGCTVPHVPPGVCESGNDATEQQDSHMETVEIGHSFGAESTEQPEEPRCTDEKANSTILTPGLSA